MKKYLTIIVTGVLLASGLHAQTGIRPKRGVDNIAYHWGQVALLCTANDTERFRPRPTVTSRFLGLIWTAIFDAWSRYDDKAIPLYLSHVNRQPVSQRTLSNKEIAVSYAAYRAMREYFFSDSLLLEDVMKGLDLDPSNYSKDPDSPAGIGNLAAAAVISQRMDDGANQSGLRSGSNGNPYSDYTGYKPVNSADTLTELKRWQPKYFSDGKGGRFAPACLTPQWAMIRPLMLDSAAQFRPIPPPAIGSETLNAEIEQVVSLQANMTNEQRALVELMRDGPKSVQQAGHWLVFAQEVSRRDHHTLDEDVKMYFLIEAAAMDAFIACWEAKMYYDFARPYSLVHDYYQDQTIQLWGGPETGTVSGPGKSWRPYSPETFLCPPFPGYVSGHSTVSAACAEVLRLFCGSDYFGISITAVPGAATEPDRIGEPVQIHFPTFTETAAMAGFSRVIGGYHIQSDNIEGLRLGRNVAAVVWKKFCSYTGTNPSNK